MPPPITKTIHVRRTRHVGHCSRSRDELISDVLLWTPTYGRAKAGWPARTYIQQLCDDMGCSPEDLSEAMNAWEKWRERVRDIRASGTTWWWWWWWYIYLYIYIYIYVCVCGVMAKVMVYGLDVSDFEQPSHYYVHFRTSNLGKSHEPTHLFKYGLNTIVTVLLQRWL